ncbi:hypothetical protein BV364_01429 [Pseudomonas syringae pv. actinidiae]|nr:hypothetical protein BV364_01429 [Pseudomonas syringae pv. actinidiae]
MEFFPASATKHTAIVNVESDSTAFRPDYPGV